MKLEFKPSSEGYGEYSSLSGGVKTVFYPELKMGSIISNEREYTVTLSVHGIQVFNCFNGSITTQERLDAIEKVMNNLNIQIDVVYSCPEAITGSEHYWYSQIGEQSARIARNRRELRGSSTQVYKDKLKKRIKVCKILKARAQTIYNHMVAARIQQRGESEVCVD